MLEREIKTGLASHPELAAEAFPVKRELNISHIRHLCKTGAIGWGISFAVFSPSNSMLINLAILGGIAATGAMLDKAISEE